MSKTIKFNEIETEVSSAAGFYEIYTNSGLPLKVGIGQNIRKRLKDHRASRQKSLRLDPGGNRDNPNDVKSKQSILAKHMYYDESITSEYDLKTEEGRRAFLDLECYILFEYTNTLDDARQFEALKERVVPWRYIGNVVKR